jgi:hypothetical protein
LTDNGEKFSARELIRVRVARMEKISEELLLVGEINIFSLFSLIKSGRISLNQ